MHRFWKTLTGITLVAGFGALTLVTAGSALAQEAAKPAKKVKDQIGRAHV